MKEKKNLQIITEGKTKILVYKNKKYEKGPGFRGDEPFYNPSMEMNRDLSIAINQWLIDHNKNKLKILDGLASSGIRGVRFANELKGNFDIILHGEKELADYIANSLKQLASLSNFNDNELKDVWDQIFMFKDKLNEDRLKLIYLEIKIIETT